VTVLGTDAIAYSTIARHLRETRWIAGKGEGMAFCPDGVGQAVLTGLEEKPFSSGQDLAKRVGIPPSTVHQRLTNSLSFVAKHLRHRNNLCINYYFLDVVSKRVQEIARGTEAQLAARVQISSEGLRIVCSVQHTGWQSFLTLDESWFYFSTDHGIMWLRENEPPAQREKHMIQAK
jgi:hypothetical protein